MQFALLQNPYATSLYPPHLRHVAALPWEIKNADFCRYLTDMEENANKLHFIA